MAEQSSDPTVVSTSPSGTEILCSLGVEPAVVSGSCDHPPSVTDRPRLDRSRVDGATSAERDDQASSSHEVYDVDADLLREVEPDLILTQSVCGVCAVDEGRVREILADEPADPEVLGMRTSDLPSVLDTIETVGAAVGREDRAARLVGQLADCFATVESITAEADDRPSVAVFEWLDPLHLAANWVPELVDFAGGDYPLADPGDRSVKVDWDDVREAAPDVIIVAPCSYTLDDSFAAIEELTDRPGWEALPAVQNDRVYVLDGKALNRWTPRLAGECQRIATVLHPERFEGEPLAERL
jgi:iron complex transport system substrate-binding protein